MKHCDGDSCTQIVRQTPDSFRSAKAWRRPRVARAEARTTSDDRSCSSDRARGARCRFALAQPICESRSISEPCSRIDLRYPSLIRASGHLHPSARVGDSGASPRRTQGPTLESRTAQAGGEGDQNDHRGSGSDRNWNALGRGPILGKK